MNAPSRDPSSPALRWWRLVLERIVRFFSRGRERLRLATSSTSMTELRTDKELRAVFGEGAAELDGDLQDVLRGLGREGVVVDTIAQAIEDYDHLRAVITGPGATTDAVDDVTLLAEAEATLRAIIMRAPDIKVLVDVASQRGTDRPGREAAGDAILKLRDQGTALHALTSAALRWASSRSQDDSEHMRRCAEQLTAWV